MCENNVYEFVILHIRPGHVGDFLMGFEKGKAIMEKYGQKMLGMWVGEAGTVGTIYILKEWASIGAKLKFKDSLLADNDARAYFKGSGEHVLHSCAYMCKTHDVKPINPKHPVVIHKLVPKSFTHFAAARHKHVVEMVSAKMPAGLAHHVTLLFPIMYEEFALISIFEIEGENKVDEAYNAILARMKDPVNWAAMATSQEIYCDHFNILCRPIDWSKLPK